MQLAFIPLLAAAIAAGTLPSGWQDAEPHASRFTTPSVQTPPDASALATILTGTGDSTERSRLAGLYTVSVRLEIMDALLASGAFARTRGEFASADRCFAVALDLAVGDMRQDRMSQAVEGLGTIAVERGDYEAAGPQLERALALAESAGRPALVASALISRATLRFRQGALATALEDAGRALALAEEVDDPALIPAALNTMAAVLRNQGQLDAAVAHYERALPLAERGGAQPVLARILNNLGVAENARGNPDRALQLYEASLRVSEALEYRWSIASTLSNIGLLSVDLGDNARALAYLERSLAISETIGERRTAAHTLGAIGLVYSSQGRDDLALEYFTRQRELAESIGERIVAARATRLAGGVYLARGDYERARDAFERVLALDQAIGNQEGVGDAHQALSRLHQRRGDLDAALRHASMSTAARDPVQDGRTLPMSWLRLAEVRLARGDHADALQSAALSISGASATGHASRLWRAQLTAGRALRGLDRPAEARNMFEAAIAVIESLRDRTIGGEEDLQRAFEGRLAPYYEMCELLLETGDQAGALAYAERAKGRVLLDVLRSGRVNVTTAMTPADQQRERTLDAEIATLTSEVERARLRGTVEATDLRALDARLARARADVDAFRAALYAAHPELQVQRGQARPATFDDLARLVDDDSTVLLEYVVTGRRAWLFAIARHRTTGRLELAVHGLDASAASLTQAVEAFRGSLEARDLAFRGAGRALHDRLLGPVLETLQGRTRLVIVPDGALWDLPFQALIQPSGRFLLEEAAVTLVPSLTVWRELTRSRPAAAPRARSILALGNPTPDGDADAGVLRGLSAAPLPSAEREARLVADLYDTERSVTLTGAAAREDRLKEEAPHHAILHIASHGVLDNRSPMYSHLVLASAPGAWDSQNDGRLLAREILALPLRAELAVLSGCETARGRVGAGEGMIGLSWAFFIAGTPTTVVSQWRVDSESTAELMVNFHGRLVERAGRAPVAIAEALRQSALELLGREQYRHPFYWAGFVAVGDGLRSLGTPGRPAADAPR